MPTGIELTSVFDGVSFSAIDTTPVISSFDTAIVRLGSLNAPFRIDNVRVEFAPNRAPLFTADPLVRFAPPGAPFHSSIAPDVTDPGAHEAPLFSKISGPAWLSVSPDGSLSGTSPAEAGAHSFTVRATDAFGLFTDATLLVHIAHPVTVTASSPFARESGGLDGAFLITREGPLDSDLAVHFTLSGTTTEGADYTAPASPVVIPAGRTSATVTISPIADDLFEDDETVILTLAREPGYFAAEPSSATVTIVDAQIVRELARDTFDIGAPPTPGDDAEDPADLVWTASGGTLSLAADSPIGTGNALSLATTGTFNLVQGLFDTAQLAAPGDRLTLSLDFRYTSAPPANGGGFRFGFTSAAAPDNAFALQLGTGGTTSAAFLRDGPGDSSPGSGAGVVSLETTSSGPSGIGSTAPLALSFSITRTASGYRLDASAGPHTHTAFSGTGWNSFDTVFVRNGGIGTPFRIDNVEVSLERNRPPFFTSSPVVKPAAGPGTPYLESLASDIDDPNPGDTLAIAKLDGPSWLEVAPDGTLSGTPGPGDLGENLFTIRLADPHGLSTESVLVIEVVDPLTPLETWRLLHFGEDAADPTIAGNDADPDGDGLSNLVEYALGLDPQSSSSAPAAVREDGLFSILYTANLLATDVTITPEWSADLSAWESDGILIETLDETGSTLKASIPATEAAAFLRLKIVAP